MAVGDARLTKCHYGTEGAEVNSRGVMRGLASVTHGTLATRVCALKGHGKIGSGLLAVLTCTLSGCKHFANFPWVTLAKPRVTPRLLTSAPSVP